VNPSEDMLAEWKRRGKGMWESEMDEMMGVGSRDCAKRRAGVISRDEEPRLFLK
jgi:hypothetical protein